MKVAAALQRPAQAAQQRGQVFEALGDQVTHGGYPRRCTLPPN